MSHLRHHRHLPPSGVGALIICIMIPNTTPPNRPAAISLPDCMTIPPLHLGSEYLRIGKRWSNPTRKLMESILQLQQGWRLKVPLKIAPGEVNRKPREVDFRARL